MCDLGAKCPKPLIEMQAGAQGAKALLLGQIMSDQNAGLLRSEGSTSSTKESRGVQLTVFYSVEYSRERCWGW